MVVTSRFSAGEPVRAAQLHMLLQGFKLLSVDVARILFAELLGKWVTLLFLLFLGNWARFSIWFCLVSLGTASAEKRKGLKMGL